MERRTGTPRAGWRRTVTEQGLVYDAPGRGQGGVERPYWDESVHYVFSMDEILALDADVELLHSMCLKAVDHVVLTERFRDFALPEWSWEAVAASRRRRPALYGRFDLRYDGSGPPKLLEYNADTPTALLEASILQWYWLKDTPPRRRPVELPARAARRAVGDDRGRAAVRAGALHLVVGRRHRRGPRDRRLPAGDRRPRPASTPSACRSRTSAGTPRSTASSTWRTGPDPTGSSSSTRGSGCSPTRTAPCAAAGPATTWIEPAWKLLLSNKALLAVLWELYPDHPNLLPAYLDQPGSRFG